MSLIIRTTKTIPALIAASLLLSAFAAQATIVTFNTSQGEVKVNLFDKTTPKTVKNFLTYVEGNSYDQTVIHRSAKDFVIQGGGFTYENAKLKAIESNAAVLNEPVYSNVKGTIAMAKLGGRPDSATNQWFFNMRNNSANLDVQNGGFTVFGQVIEGQDVLDKIGALITCDNFAGNTAYDDVPVTYTNADNCTDGTVAGFEDLVSITTIDITDSTEDTASNLSPVKNTLITRKPTDESSGGALAWLALAGLGFAAMRRKR